MNYLSVAEAAELLGVSRQRVYELVDLDILKAERIGNHVVLDKKQVLKRKEQNPQPGRPKSC